MKQLTLAEFYELFDSKEWDFKQEIEEWSTEVGSYEHLDDEDNEQSFKYKYAFGAVRVIATSGKLKVIHTREYQYTLNQPESLEVDDLAVGSTEEPSWRVEGFEVIDEEGEEIDLGYYIDRNCLPEELFEIDEAQFEIKEPAIEIDLDKTKGSITLELEHDPDIKFSGDLVAEASSYDVCNNNLNWSDFSLYKTVSGKYVCFSEEISRWNDGNRWTRAKITESEKEVIEFFGTGDLAHELYENAGIRK